MEDIMTLSSKQKKIALIVLIVIAGMAVLGGVATGIYFGVSIIPVEGVVLGVTIRLLQMSVLLMAEML